MTNNKTKLIDYINLYATDEEIIITDKTIDIEVYGYGKQTDKNDFFTYLAGRVYLTEIKTNCIIVDFYEFFNQNKKIAKEIYNLIFTNEINNNDDIASEWIEILDKIFAGYISENAEMEIVRLFKEKLK